MSPSTVNTIGAPQTVTLDARVVVAPGSSFYYGYVYLYDPTFGQAMSISFSNWQRVSGDGADGVYRGTAILPPYSRGGAWVWYQAVVYNQLFHYNYYYSPQNDRFRYRQTWNGANYTTTDLGTSGPTFSPTTLSVVSIADVVPPTLVNFELNPSSIDVSTSYKYVTLTLAATDDLSGFNYGCAYFVSPNGQQNRGTCVSSPGATGSIFFPQYSQAGNWALNYLYLAARGETDHCPARAARACGHVQVKAQIDRCSRYLA